MKILLHNIFFVCYLTPNTFLPPRSSNDSIFQHTIHAHIQRTYAYFMLKVRMFAFKDRDNRNIQKGNQKHVPSIRACDLSLFPFRTEKHTHVFTFNLHAQHLPRITRILEFTDQISKHVHSSEHARALVFSTLHLPPETISVPSLMSKEVD